MSQIPRAEYPRPQFVRDAWVCLNGEWDFSIDGDTLPEGFSPVDAPFDRVITVPFCPESALSGIQITDFMKHVRYRRRFPSPTHEDGDRVLLHIGACDYAADIYVNGMHCGSHRGGYISFSCDVTDCLCAGENTLVIAVADDTRDGAQPTGKQSAERDSFGCYYTRTTGIWQTVWLEVVPACFIQSVKLTPDIDRGTLQVTAVCEGADGVTLCARASLDGVDCGEDEAIVSGTGAQLTVALSRLCLWETESPVLYDLTLTLGRDKVRCYFGMRSVDYSAHRFRLNHKPVCLRLVLDQGFYPDGIYTAPTDAALQADIERAMACGFNGARLHEKIFEERFLYHCDRLGYLVFGEYPNWGLDLSRPEAFRAFLPEWCEELQRDYNHPSLIGWCPFNETQSDQDGDLIRAVYHITKQIDQTRPVIDCSGWTHVISDIYDVHDYEQDPADLRARYAPLAKGLPFEPNMPSCGIAHTEQVSFLSEYGGMRCVRDASLDNSWGYGSMPQSDEAFLARFRDLTLAILENPAFCGFCYTQLTDIEQEQNGLFTYHRVPKFDPARLRAVLTTPAACEMDNN